MNRLLSKTLLITLLFTSAYNHAATYEDKLREIVSLGLPVIVIETTNAEEPTAEIVTHPEGAWGTSITNATKVPAKLQIIIESDTVYDSGNYVEKKTGITIKLRGNTSANSEKKPYKIKLQKKADLIRLCNNSYAESADKDWILLKENYANQIIGCKLSELFGMEWTPRNQYVNLILNGSYRGLYILTESVKISDSRVAVDKDSGFISEIDAYWWNEDYYNKKTLVTGQFGYTMKDPDAEDASEQLIHYIERSLDTLENAIINGNYPERLDVESAARWILAQDILGVKDAGGTNLYLAKQDTTANTKFRMPLLWDYDGIRSLDVGKWASVRNYHYFPCLFDSSNTMFVIKYKQLFFSLYKHLLDDFTIWSTNYIASAEASMIDNSYILDQNVWGGSKSNTKAYFNHMIGYLSKRLSWIESEMRKTPKYDVNTDGLVSMNDANTIITCYLNNDLGNIDPYVGDINEDGIISMADANEIVRKALEK